MGSAFTESCAKIFILLSMKLSINNILILFIESGFIFCYCFVNWNNRVNSRKKSNYEQSTGKRTHCNSPFFPAWKVMAIARRHVVHRQKGVKQGRSYNKITFEPCTYNNHASGYKHGEWL